MKVVEAKKLNKVFINGREEAHVLKNIDLEIEQGEFVTIMGPSGCGKSTLLYLLGGLDNPTSGTVKINQKDLTKISENEKCYLRGNEIGFVFQFYNLVPNLNVEDNILLPLMLGDKKISSYKSKLKELLRLIGMEDKMKLTPRELSGGQQQRVAIARSLIFDPDIIFLDEPIGNLDSKIGTEIMQLFKEINKKYGKTIIQVSHSIEAASYGTYIYNMIDGEIRDIKKVG